MNTQTRSVVAIILGIVALGAIFGSKSMTWLDTSSDGERAKLDYSLISDGLAQNDAEIDSPTHVDLWFDIGIWVSAGLVAVAFALALTGPTGKVGGVLLCLVGLAFALAGGLGVKGYVEDLILAEGDSGSVSIGPGLIVICVGFVLAIVAVLQASPPGRTVPEADASTAATE